ncbi:kinase-like domain-containing protein [Hyaloscypha finlandica]|nr:kinase-like domain-containing protein [Hyaloscypha finlandica]
MIVPKPLYRYTRPLYSHLPYIVSSPIISSSRPPRILPANVLVEEGRVPGYRPEFCYPENPGEVLNNCYKILTKVGWGTASTVWLAEDLERQPFQHVTLKITTSNPNYGDTILHELEVNKRLTKYPSLPGFAFVRAAFDHFIATDPTGAARLCLVFEAMREPLSQFQHRLVGDHLKAGNIMMCFEDPSVIEEYVNAQGDHPMPRKTVSDRNLYLSHNDFGALKSYWTLPKTADFGLAHRGYGEKPFRHPIQPPLYHAPGVLLGIPWSYSADIWNLCVFVKDKELFVHLKSQNGVYNAQAQSFADIIALLGPPPQDLIHRLIDQEKHWRDVPWERLFPSPGGTWCKTAREYYGYFTHPQIIPTKVKLDNCLSCMEGEETALFLTFVRRVLQWLPEDGDTEKKLREDPWLRSGLD